jgi:hypothetical protein
LDLGELVEALNSSGTCAEVIGDIDELAIAVAAAARPNEDVILAMSGRDFHGIHGKVLTRLGAQHG